VKISRVSSIRLLLFLIPLAFRAVAPCLADGGLFPPYEDFLFEREQQALIVHNAETHIEEMTLLVGFHGNAEDFAWIVPVPARPQLEPAAMALFRDCWALTRPVWRDDDEWFGCGSETIRSGEDSDTPVIFDDQVVGIYHTLTLGADEAGPLADSLDAWGFLHDANRQETLAALQHYIDKSWCFVAMRIDSAGALDELDDRGWYGSLQPIRLIFPSEQIVYPMRISAVSATQETPLTLFVCADHRMTFPQATVEYANRFSETEFEEARETYSHLAPRLRAGVFVTRLHRVFTPEEMTDDLLLERAANDREFVLIRQSGFTDAQGLDAGFVACALLGAGFLLAGRKRRRAEARNGSGDGTARR